MDFDLNYIAPLSWHEAASPRWYSYSCADDATATIGASAYFNDVATNLNIGDVIHTVDSGGVSTLHNVTAVDPDVTVSTGTAIA